MSPDGSGEEVPADRPRHVGLEADRRQADVSHDDLWLRYFSLTGDAARLEIEAYLQGLMPLPAIQEDILAQAMRECINEKGTTHPDPGAPDGPPPH